MQFLSWQAYYILQNDLYNVLDNQLNKQTGTILVTSFNSSHSIDK